MPKAPKNLFQKMGICQNPCLCQKFWSHKTYAENFIPKNFHPKILCKKVYAKIRNQFLWLQFDFLRNCDWLRVKFRCDFFNRSRFSYLYWFRNCYFRFQNLFLKWQNKFFCWNFKFWFFYWKFSWSNSIICIIASFTFA